MCQEFCPQGEVYTPSWTHTHTMKTPTSHPLSRHNPWTYTRLGRQPALDALSGHTLPVQTPPPPCQIALPHRRPLQWTVHILLECILLMAFKSLGQQINFGITQRCPPKITIRSSASSWDLDIQPTCSFHVLSPNHTHVTWVTVQVWYSPS